MHPAVFFREANFELTNSDDMMVSVLKPELQGELIA